MLLDKGAQLDQATDGEPNKLAVEEVSGHGTDLNCVASGGNFFRLRLLAENIVAESHYGGQDS